MATRRWTNPTQPQTLQIAVFLLYANAFFLVLFGGFTSPIYLLFIGANIGAAFGIANEKRWGYNLGLFAAFAPFVLRFALGGVSGLFGVNIITLMFDLALVALLLHPQSRDYQRIWFS